MFFEQGLSGLNAAAQSLSVVGKNIANANTVGYKSASINFSDVMSNSLGANSSGLSLQTGAGPTNSHIQQSFSQGTISASTNPLDVAINGNGFFRMVDGTTSDISYTRAGQFQLDATGGIVNAIGQKLSGYMATNGVINTGALTPLNLSEFQTMAQSITSEVRADLNLHAGTTGIDATTSTTVSGVTSFASTFDPTDSTKYNFSAPTTVYDSLGVSHNLQLYFTKNSTTNTGADSTWNVYSTPATTTSGSDFSTLGQVNFDADGVVTSANTIGVDSAKGIASSAGVAFGINTFTGVPIDGSGDLATIDLSALTQQGAQSYTNNMTQNGYPAGIMSKFHIGNDGQIIGTYTNGESQTLGQVALATFASTAGLQALGNNSWLQTSYSGIATTGAPGAGGLGALQSSALEMSNVDQTADMVALLAAQRAFQANAQTIKAEDQIAQTLVNMA
ncbi:hypothetical protein CBI30_05270 [Polynucleobacter aenigmaticus]|uniref:Flagellar hook protein FlgE n=1 Tax=Polynucleobacter aenigmaticus TaxID=1743164 RepID=A0A254PZ84_9BURK|nr:flagellar hook protein FlgE [Polynucleobacter aenigmaticus]OWS71863.1 hypothetical protein CBI30_05270 [Polynucleobacter aenigmaticus]